MEIKRFISIVIVVMLLSSLLMVRAADSDDPVLDATGSGWTDSNSGYPSNMNNSWWRWIFQWVRSLFTDSHNLTTGWSASSYPTSYANSWYQLIKADLDNSYDLAAGYKTGWGFNDNSLTSTRPTLYYNSAAGAILQGLEYINSDIDTIRQNTANQPIYLSQIRAYLSDIHSVIANATDVAMRNNMESSYTAINDDFLAGNGGSSSSIKASTSEYGDIKVIGGIFRSIEPAGRDASDLANAFDDGQNSLLGWFTNRTAQDLNPIMNQSRRELRTAETDDEFIDFLAPNIRLIEGSRHD